MRLAAEQTCAELARWAEPVVADILSLAYATTGVDKAARTALARSHTLLWRGLLGGGVDPEVYGRELLRLAARAGVSESMIEAANREVLAELMKIIAARYGRSPRQAGELSFEVARAACRLNRAPLAVPA